MLAARADGPSLHVKVEVRAMATFLSLELSLCEYYEHPIGQRAREKMAASGGHSYSTRRTVRDRGQDS